MNGVPLQITRALASAPASEAWGVRSNPFIERTSSGRLRLPTAAAHVER
jgi:hypothetical protein